MVNVLISVCADRSDGNRQSSAHEIKVAPVGKGFSESTVRRLFEERKSSTRQNAFTKSEADFRCVEINSITVLLMLNCFMELMKSPALVCVVCLEEIKK